MKPMLALLAFCAMLNCGRPSHAEEQLYGMASTPTPLSDERYAAVVYRVSLTQGTLSKVRALVGADAGVAFVKISSEDGLAVIGYPAFAPQRFAVFDVHRPELVIDADLVPSDCRDCVYVSSSLASDSQLGLGLRVRARSNTVREFVLPLPSGPARAYAPTAISLDDRRAEGVPGPAIAGDFYYLPSGPSGDASVPRLGFELPSGVGANSKEVLVVLGSTKEFLVLSSSRSRLHDSGVGATRVWVLSRAQGLWRTLDLPGDRTDARIVGEWLAASVATEARSAGGANSLGVSLATERRPTGNSIEVRSSQFRLALQGRLVVVNLRDGFRSDFNVGDPDSEVLSVRNDRILYRVRNGIFERKSDGSAPARLLLRDDRILDIHWLLSSAGK